MRCTSPRTVGFKADGKTICWSQRERSKEYATFQLPCGKCLECRLDYARQWAVRCVHESLVHEKNSFITLTYADEHLKNPVLDYRDFQLFMKKLRKLTDAEIGVFVTGEYGERTKRPHWHALIFGWRPADATYFRTTDQGDEVYRSETLDRTWARGNTEFGSVTFESAGYCARYAAKKLVHGKDDEHDFQPISKKSSKHAIGKKFLERHWRDIFSYGELVLPDGRAIGSIPRYYEKWLRENHPGEYLHYVTRTKLEKIKRASARAEKEKSLWLEINNRRLDAGKLTFTPSETDRRRLITKRKFEQLQNYLKLK